MNPYSGDMERFSTVEPERKIPEGWLSLTEEEAEEFQRLPKMIRIERYIKNHRTDKCAACGCFVGNHHPKKFIECAASELARIDLKRLEEQMNPAFVGG